MSSGPQFSLGWMTVIPMSLALLLTVFGLGVALSVWLSGKKHRTLMPGFGLKGTAQTLFWIAPALAVVALIAVYKNREGKLPETPALVAEQTERDPALLWSRQQVTDAPDWAKDDAEADASKAEKKINKAVSLVRRVKGDDQIPAIVVSTDPYASEEEAARELTPRVVDAVSEELRAGFPVAGDWKVPVKLIASEGIANSDNLVLEQFDKDFGLGRPDKMYRLHCRVPLTPQLRDVVYQDWKSQVVSYRLTRLGGATGLLVGLAATISMYLGLNAATQGMYRWRLRLAAASGLSAMAVAVGTLLLLR